MSAFFAAAARSDPACVEACALAAAHARPLDADDVASRRQAAAEAKELARRVAEAQRASEIEERNDTVIRAASRCASAGRRQHAPRDHGEYDDDPIGGINRLRVEAVRQQLNNAAALGRSSIVGRYERERLRLADAKAVAAAEVLRLPDGDASAVVRLRPDTAALTCASADQPDPRAASVLERLAASRAALDTSIAEQRAVEMREAAADALHREQLQGERRQLLARLALQQAAEASAKRMDRSNESVARANLVRQERAVHPVDAYHAQVRADMARAAAASSVQDTQ